jgi:hypothetical protein
MENGRRRSRRRPFAEAPKAPPTGAAGKNHAAELPWAIQLMDDLPADEPDVR